MSVNAPSPNLAFSSIIKRNEKRNIEKSIAETNPRLNNFCMQKGIGFIDTKNIKEDFPGKKKLNLSQRRNSVSLQKILLKYIEKIEKILYLILTS